MKTSILKTLLAITVISTLLASCVTPYGGRRNNNQKRFENKKNMNNNRGRNNRRP